LPSDSDATTPLDASDALIERVMLRQYVAAAAADDADDELCILQGFKIIPCDDPVQHHDALHRHTKQTHFIKTGPIIQ
jgi:hypothetical protein